MPKILTPLIAGLFAATFAVAVTAAEGTPKVWTPEEVMAVSKSGAPKTEAAAIEEKPAMAAPSKSKARKSAAKSHKKHAKKAAHKHRRHGKRAAK